MKAHLLKKMHAIKREERLGEIKRDGGVVMCPVRRTNA